MVLAEHNSMQSTPTLICMLSTPTSHASTCKTHKAHPYPHRMLTRAEKGTAAEMQGVTVLYSRADPVTGNSGFVHGKS